MRLTTKRASKLRAVAPAWRRLGQAERRGTAVRPLDPWALHARRRHLPRRRELPLPSTPSSSVWQRLGLALLFATMASAGFGCYAGYARVVGEHGGQVAIQARGSARTTRKVVPSAPLVPLKDDADTRAWLTKARTLAAVAAFIALGDVANVIPFGL